MKPSTKEPLVEHSSKATPRFRYITTQQLLDEFAAIERHERRCRFLEHVAVYVILFALAVTAGAAWAYFYVSHGGQ